MTTPCLHSDPRLQHSLRCWGLEQRPAPSSNTHPHCGCSQRQPSTGTRWGLRAGDGTELTEVQTDINPPWRRHATPPRTAGALGPGGSRGGCLRADSFSLWTSQGGSAHCLSALGWKRGVQEAPDLLRSAGPPLSPDLGRDPGKTPCPRLGVSCCPLRAQGPRTSSAPEGEGTVGALREECGGGSARVGAARAKQVRGAHGGGLGGADAAGNGDAGGGWGGLG